PATGHSSSRAGRPRRRRFWTACASGRGTGAGPSAPATASRSSAARRSASAACATWCELPPEACLMDWVTDEIAIGNYLEAQDTTLLRREGIRSVLCLDRTLQEQDAGSSGLEAIRCVPLEDGPGNDARLFRRAVDALTGLCQGGGPVLVQCHAGRSRS